ncbi:MAG: hypothetical protein HRF43_20030 [Phycisphaerae bacterium]|jgi:hypothetical protein
MMRMGSTMIVAVSGLAGALMADDLLVVHEWGTFTSLQDETGRALGGLNADDEPLPPFVHSVESVLMRHPPGAPLRTLPGGSTSGERVAPGVPLAAARFGKGLSFVAPWATMRLETPVMYFYPPAGAKLPLRIDVKARFRNGWLTQFYPDARVHGVRLAPGETSAAVPAGTLEWRGLAVGGTESWPVTDSNVWLAPRGVASATVTAAQIDKPAQTDSEKYLFYRGIGRLNAPLTVRRDQDALTIRPADDLEPVKGFPMGTLWLVEVREDQALAFRELDGQALSTSPRGMLTTAAAFAPSDFAAGNLRGLREALHKALVADGLFADEAYALLNTWDQSYFKTAGQRLFYLVPRAWTDYHLPLELSVPAQVARVMVARTELVTPGQRTLLEAVVAGRSAQEQRLQAAAAEAYRRLGRFRDALIADHDQRSSSPEPATRQAAAGRPEPTRSGAYTP